MPVYSHSRLAAYENCPQQFKLKYIDRIELPEGKEGIEAFLGSRVHEALEKLHKELVLTKLNSLEDLLDYYLSQWDKNWDEETVEIVKKDFTPEHYKNTGIEAIRSYYKRYYPFDQSKTIATEYQIAFRIDEYTLQGFIDRLSCSDEGVYEIHDYKTSGTLPSQEKIDSDRQLALYQIGIRKKFRDVKDVRLVWHYLIFDKKLTSTRSETQLEDLKKQVISLIKTIERDTQFKPVESNLCDWCDYPEYCPAKKHETKVRALPRNQYLTESGVELVNKYAAIKTRIMELKGEEKRLQEELDLIADAAIEYAGRECITVITGSDNKLKVSEQTVYQFPRADGEERKELEEYIKVAGLWEDVSTLNLQKLNRIIQHEEVASTVKDGLIRFAELETKIVVKLVKSKDTER